MGIPSAMQMSFTRWIILLVQVAQAAKDELLRLVAAAAKSAVNAILRLSSQRGPTFDSIFF